MGEHGINVFSNSPNIIEILTKGSFVHFIPEYHCVQEKAPSDYTLVYVSGESFSTELSATGRVIKIVGPEQEVIAGQTLPYMIHYMLEQQRHANSQATMRGAAVSLDGKGVLLIGKRGSGKTSITLELCRNYRYSLIGADLVLIGLRDNRACLFGGTKVFTLRLTTVTAYNTDLKKYFGRNSLRERGPDQWTTKIDMLPQEIGVSVERNPVGIAKAFYVHLENDPAAPLAVKQIGTSETLYMGRLYLHEELTRYIRGTCIPILKGSDPDFAGYLPPLDKPEYYGWRVGLVNWLIEELGLYYLGGSMKRICDFISEGMLA